VVQQRYERLAELVNQVAWDENKRLVGRTVELMVAEGEGRKDEQTARLSGRAPDNRLVHFRPIGTDSRPVDVRPGDCVDVEVTYAAPHHLVADGPPQAHRRTRAGDAHEAGQRPTGTGPGGAPTGLGLPGFGTPAPLPAVTGCAVGTGGGAG
jgi:tRNA-2-methylthio-N6-dimethylallyladenosine synthase